MHAKPSNNSMAMIGTAAKSKSERIATPELLAAWAVASEPVVALEEASADVVALEEAVSVAALEEEDLDVAGMEVALVVVEVLVAAMVAEAEASKVDLEVVTAVKEEASTPTLRLHPLTLSQTMQLAVETDQRRSTSAT